MSKLPRIFLTGWFISFLGSLPLGTLNIAAMQIAITDGIQPAILFSLGSLTAEVIYVRLSLMAMDWVRKQQKLFQILEWVTLLIVVALAVSSFYAAMNPTVQKKCNSKQHAPSLFSWLNNECPKPCANSVLVRVEHCFIYKKNPFAQGKQLQCLYNRHRFGNFIRQRCFYFWRKINCQ